MLLQFKYISNSYLLDNDTNGLRPTNSSHSPVGKAFVNEFNLNYYLIETYHYFQ